MILTLNLRIMQIFINDRPCEYPEKINVTTLLARENIRTDYIAVALNDTVIPRSQWDFTELTDGCRILIIKAVQGG